MSSFVEWVQGRLVAHNFNIAVDGDWGRESINALKRFQAKMGIHVSGVTDETTVSALSKAANIQDTNPKSTKDQKETMPPWMQEMHRKMGLHEIRNNSELIKLMKIGKYLGNPKDLPWCGDAVESVIVKTLTNESVPSNPFWAQGWNTFGIDVKDPIVGSIGVIRWNSRSGHVGIVCGYDPVNKRVYLLGGNQSNEINITSFPLSKFIGFRWPKTYPVKHYPPLKASSVSIGDLGNTR